MGRHYDLAIVGGGIVGLGHAVAALRRGLTVAVVDRASRVNGASIRNFGHLGITGQEGEARAYAELARDLWLTLSIEAGFWLRECGSVVVAQAADELAVLEEFRDRRGGHDVRLLTPAQVREQIPVAHGVAVGGAHLPADLLVDPREAAPAIARWLDAHGVDFYWQTTVSGVETGRVHTSRGRVSADAVVVAVNQDVDQLFPGIAEADGIQRCDLDMMLVEAELDEPLAAAMLTGWSLLRFPGFARTPSADALRERLAAEEPVPGALDANLMYVQRPDGSLILGDTRDIRHSGDDVSPFQSEAASDLLVERARTLFGLGRVRVVERWQGIDAWAPDDFLVSSPAPSVRVVSVTCGVGMTTGLGLADRVVDELFSSTPAVLTAAGAVRSR